MTPSVDYGLITETPGTYASEEQISRFAHRYVTGAKLARDRRVLEVACGAGTGLGSLHPESSWLTGLDATEALLHQARGHYGPEPPLACGDGQRLPYAESAFDLVLCFEAIYYMADYRLFLREALRVLARRGHLLIVSSNPDWPEFVPGNLSVHYPSVPELAREMEAVGFHKVRMAGFLPAQAYTTKQKVISRLRRYGILAKVAPRTGRLAHWVKRLSYGRLFALPPVVTLESLAPHAARLTPQALPIHQIDRAHRVLYAYGEKPG